MIQPSPPRPPHQSALTAVELSLKDGLRTLGFNLHMGARWLVDDVAPRLAQQIDPTGISGKRETLHSLADSAARGTLSTLESVKQRAASTALADEPYRTLDFTLQPLRRYFSAQDPRNPSGLFAEVFYWLLRHALAMQPEAQTHRALVHQRAVDQAYWIVQTGRAHRTVQADSDDDAHAQTASRHAELCAQLLRALDHARPVRDATVLPWGLTDATKTESARFLPILLRVVLAAGSVRPHDGIGSSAAAHLRLGHQIASARHSAFARALDQWPADHGASLSAEFAFVFRHL